MDDNNNNDLSDKTKLLMHTYPFWTAFSSSYTSLDVGDNLYFIAKGEPDLTNKKYSADLTEYAFDKFGSNGFVKLIIKKID